MISGKKLFIEISNQPVHEDGESVGYFIKNSRMNDLETLLNATAQPKCQKCGDTGMADSGGAHPWGEPILIDCDCATAQPVSDGRTMRGHEFSQLVNELRDVPASQSKREKIVGILKAFNIRPAAPGGRDD